MDKGYKYAKICQTQSKLLIEAGLDSPGIIWFEHLNFSTGDANLTHYFYEEFLGIKKCGYGSYHYNIGQQQFHVKEDKRLPPQVLNGAIGITVNSLYEVRANLDKANIALKGWFDAAMKLFLN